MPPGMPPVISSLQCPCTHSYLHQLSSLELVGTKVYMSALSHMVEHGHASLPVSDLGERFGRTVWSDILSGHADARMKSH